MKKRIVAMFLAVCFIVTLLPTAAFAAEKETDTMTGFCGADASYEAQTYNFASSGYTCTGTYYSNAIWKLTPNATGYTLSISGTGEIGDFNENDTWSYNRPWHYVLAEKESKPVSDSRNMITKIEISDGITKIGSHTFEAYEKVTSIVLPESVTEIGDYAFNYCKGIKTVKFPSDLKTLGKVAFSDSGLTSVVFPASLEVIGDKAFKACDSMYAVDATNVKASASYGTDVFINMNIPNVIYVKDAGQNGSIMTSNRTAGAVTNGGTFDADTEFEEGALATPKKEGFKFNGWYKDADFSGQPVETAEAGNTYYAKYRKKARNGITIVDEEGARIGTLPNADEDSTVKLPNTFDGIPEGKIVSSWEVVEPQGLTIENNSFKMPVQRVKLRAILADKPAEEEPGQTVSGGDDGATAAAVILGGAAIGAVSYAVGTQIWMETHLPDGAIPTSREQLALMLWNAAGRPQPAGTALYADISAEAADTQLAARWCVEQGLMKDYGESFKPGKYTFRWQVIKAWNRVQKTN